ncbi:NAD(P)/FAD-dependent oxidoreductase [Thalassotalea psychrophila]|uniref:Pyridine nucleotide-disulfide oxidoreductase domain-containing protein 2 n=1 Tax=Thalassotalea psychrophila TaxID=3065647 RepID=A0ABY9TTC0_9GAMM|nr:NAD(P)/FAD-dependent oxidoreductase [Colwelliaceae bacterium SQ149]
MNHFDTIIIGAGHNGLVCGSYLGKNGQKVLILEAAEQLGGLAATREFSPGFNASVAQTISHFSTKVAKELNLSAHGFDVAAAPMTNISLNKEGNHVTLTSSGEITGVGSEDQQNYQQYQQLLKRFANLLKPFWLKTMPRIGSPSIKDNLTFAHLGIKMRMLGKQDMAEFMRVATLPARDLMDENFDSDQLKALLSWDGLIGSKMAPRSPNATILALLYRMSGLHDGAHSLPSGGIASLINSLHKAATKAGVEVQTNSKVKQILIQADETGLKANGVELQSGEIISADRVVSAVDPKRTFLDLVGPQHLEIDFTSRINRLRCDGYVAKLHLALSDLPNFTGLTKPDGRMIIADELDSIEFAFDDAKYGEPSQKPVMEIVIPSLHNPELAPSGQHVLSAHVMYVPYKHKNGWTEQAKADLYERVIDTIAEYAPDIREKIIDGEILTPLDLEQQFNVTGGHWHHTELSISQMLMMRPTYEAAQYSTPIPGLYLCGAGSHPGGGLIGGPGHNAANEIIKASK